MSPTRRTATKLAIAATAVAAMLGAAALRPRSSNADPSLGQLNSQLGAVQAQQQTLSSSLANLGRLISSLDGQIALVESREAEVRAELARDRQQLAAVQAQLAKERKLLAALKAKLAFAQMLLARQVVSDYETDPPDLVSVMLNAHGFNDLLEQLDFLKRAEHQQQTIIQLTRVAKAQATAAAKRYAALAATERKITNAAAVRAAALAGMNALLHSREGALRTAQAAQQAALAAAKSKGQQLQSQIAHVQAEQAAAERAAAATSTPAGVGPALGPSGGWVIPYAIVLCESGGQNMPPNWAGASGYYQIIPSTWALYGGTGPAAYLASKAEQDAVASRIWNRGAGVNNWDCARIVGIT